MPLHHVSCGHLLSMTSLRRGRSRLQVAVGELRRDAAVNQVVQEPLPVGQAQVLHPVAHLARETVGGNIRLFPWGRDGTHVPRHSTANQRCSSLNRLAWELHDACSPRTWQGHLPHAPATCTTTSTTGRGAASESAPGTRSSAAR